MNLDGLHMYVSTTAAQGVVGSDTRPVFVQRGAKVLARYKGGSVTRGYRGGIALVAQLSTLLNTDLPALAQQMEKAGAPWTPGRVPTG